mgnify:CR=1 FL=1
MSVYCENTLTVHGNTKNLESFHKDIEEIKEDNNGDVYKEYNIRKINPLPSIFKNIKTGHIKIKGIQYTIWKEIDTEKEDEDGYSLFQTVPLTQKEKDELMEKYGAINGYDWDIKNYGTKWDNSDETNVKKEFYDNSDDLNKFQRKMKRKYKSDWFLEIDFHTNWKEPKLLLNYIAKKYNIEIENHHGEPVYDSPTKISTYPMTDKQISEFNKITNRKIKAIENAVSSITKRELYT